LHLDSWKAKREIHIRTLYSSKPEANAEMRCPAAIVGAFIVPQTGAIV
jgi:hypothetical protein